jgi:4-diphosphocytidyl-2C-methyl-D-erythritol kinase
MYAPALPVTLILDINTKKVYEHWLHKRSNRGPMLRYHQAFELLHNWQRCGYFNDLQHAYTDTAAAAATTATSASSNRSSSGGSSSSSGTAVFGNCETAESKMKAYQELLRIRQVTIVMHYYIQSWL